MREHRLTARTYLDHASTSPVRPEVAAAMSEWLSAADPGRVHAEGRAARVALEEARESVAALFGCRSRSVIFTSGATEAVNAAAFGALSPAGGACALARVEHSAVIESSQRWATSVVELTVDRTGRIDPASLPDGARLVQCQLANHEVGSLQPVAEVAAWCRDRGILLHVDAAAAVGRVPISFDELGADLMSVTAHKAGGPRGVGALLVRRGLRVAPFILGGSQERARRGGLENVAAAVGFGVLAGLLGSDPGEAGRLRSLAERLRSGLAGQVTFYGPPDPAARLAHLVCLGVEGVEAEPVLIGLDSAGIAAHSGSSCSSEELAPSPVLEAMGVDAEHSLRLSLGWSSTEADVDRVVEVLPAVVARLRSLRA